jgi:dTDP-L-rhamnose 4-epimerase
MKVFITGGAGFIGSFMAEKLLSLGYDVSILDNLDPQVHPSGLPDYLPQEIIDKVQVNDIRNREALQKALADADIVVHCAAAVGVAQSLYQAHHYVDVNVTGTALLLQLLSERDRPLKKLLIFTSMTGYGEGLYRRPSDGALVRVDIRDALSVDTYGWEPVCPQTHEVLEPVPTPESSALLASNVYALTKRYQEELSFSLGRVFNFPVVCLRLFNVYGPRQSLSNPYTGVLAIFLSRLLAGQSPVVYEDGRQSRDFISVHDVVDAGMKAIQTPEADGQVMNIGSGVPRHIGDCAVALAQLLGQDVEPLISAKFRKGDIRHCTADISLARQVLGFQPQVRWEDGLSELIAWAKIAPSSDNFQQAEKELLNRGLVK